MHQQQQRKHLLSDVLFQLGGRPQLLLRRLLTRLLLTSLLLQLQQLPRPPSASARGFLLCCLVPAEDLQRSLRNVGLAQGKTFDRSVLEEVTGYLTDQYFSRGKYAVQVDTDVVEAGSCHNR